MKSFAFGIVFLALSGGRVALADDGWRADYLGLIQKEAGVVEAAWPNNSVGSFWVSVLDDGTPRDGLAQYFCLLRGDVGAPETARFVISIWDAKAMAMGDLRKIGSTNCGG